jgi:lysyl-tRNA synthetase class 2
MSDAKPVWRPTASLEVLHLRANLLRETRRYFARRDVLEVETPVLTQAGTTDPNISNVRCRLATRPDKDFYLHTSPEYAMKRLLAAGCPDIYQICKVFRNGELGSQHQPEFTMIEWYRLNVTLEEMIDETCALIHGLFEFAVPEDADDGRLGTPARYHYRTAFRDATGLDPLSAGTDDLQQCAARLTNSITPEFAGQLGVDANAWVDFLMSHVVIPGLPDEKLVVVDAYPADQAALARLDPDDPRFAERFEVFYGGLELANGYRELLDAEEQRRRFEADRARRELAGSEDIPIDNALLAALDSGLPDCCGVALGFDRIVMSIEKLPTIVQAISFGFEAD